jgi:chromosome segregation ATPase
LIEQALLFATGFLAASLAAVLAIPFVSGRAIRLSQARAKLKAPITEKQFVAERDALRAQHAVERVRLEDRAALAEESSFGLRAELGRQAVKTIALESDASEHRLAIFDLRAEIEKRASECRNLQVALAASQIALHDLSSQLDRANVAEARAGARQTKLEQEAGRDRARIAILVARGESLEGRFEDVLRSAARAEKGHAQLAQSLSVESERVHRLEERLREAICENEGLIARLSRADAEVVENLRKLGGLESRLATSEQVGKDTLLEYGRLHGARADREEELQESDALRAAEPALSANGSERVFLRESIDRLGREVARLFAEQEREDRNDPKPEGRFALGGAGTLVSSSSDEHGLAQGSGRRHARSRASDG